MRKVSNNTPSVARDTRLSAPLAISLAVLVLTGVGHRALLAWIDDSLGQVQ